MERVSRHTDADYELSAKSPTRHHHSSQSWSTTQTKSYHLEHTFQLCAWELLQEEYIEMVAAQQVP